MTTQMSVQADDLRVEYRHGRALGIGERCPRLSWISTTAIAGWVQAAYELEIDGLPVGRTESDASVLVPWPGSPLTSRSRHGVRVRVWGADGSASPWSDPVEIEAGLLEPGDWTAEWISPVVGEAEGRPSYFRRPFTLEADPGVTIRPGPALRHLSRHQRTAPQRRRHRYQRARSRVVGLRRSPAL
jgi:alpha-L-rhamnosidase